MPLTTAPIDMTAVQAALEAWIVAATGLPAASVFHPNKKLPQPAHPYVTVQPGSIVPVGMDEQRQRYDATQPTGSGSTAGQEIEQIVIGRREFTASLQAYTANPSDGSAPQLLARCMTALRLPSRQDAIAAAALSVIDTGSVLDLGSRTVGGLGRASLDVRFNVTDSVSEWGTYIQTVNTQDNTAA